MTLLKPSKTLFPSVWSDFFDNDKFFSNDWLAKGLNQSVPAVNIKETNEAFNVEFATPGFNKNDFKIDLEGNTLTISAEKQEEKNDTKERYTRKEFSYQSFARSFTLPQIVNVEKIDANYNHGILKLHIPKKEEVKTQPKKEIKIS